MKLLFTQDALNNGGAERSHLEILSRFSREVDVSFVYLYPKHDLKQEYEKAGIRLIFLDIPESYHLQLAVSRLVKLIRFEKPDILISSLWRADVITRITSVITGVPLIGTLVNDSYAPSAWKDKKGLKYKIVYWLDRLTAGIPTHWIANSQALADSHVRTLGLDAKKISVIYRGREVPTLIGICNPDVISQEFVIPFAPSPRSMPARPSGGSPQTETTETSITHEAFRFITYGRLLERKGFQDAIHAFRQVIQSYPNSTLTIYGEGPYRTELENLIIKLELKGKVTLPGHVSGPTALLKTAHCFIFPSWYEGFSGTLVEAMMASMPIITSDIPMNLEAVIHQKTALIYPVNKFEILAEQMSFALNNPEQMAKLGEEARKVAMEKFSIDKIAKDYEAMIHSIFESAGQ
ncbi:glycosyltransferase family 4 protein [Algoriphagus resistens]|uniref:glycosyltransferase family 4 protein n=1 Tax=Algoriphagus resistens TaxID=1750590 RepID=UPI000716863B|nr:glycosyltransferase family 4 protein [Algoriphagus resistens]